MFRSSARILNPFPTHFRRDVCQMDLFPLLNEHYENPIGMNTFRWPAHRLVADLLNQQTDPVIWLSVGPLSTLAQLLTESPGLANKIQML